MGWYYGGMLHDALRKAEVELNKYIPEDSGVAFRFEDTSRPDLGDVSSSATVRLRAQGLDSVAEQVVSLVRAYPFVKEAQEVNGFLNVTFTDDTWRSELKEILTKGAEYGALDVGRGARVQVEFISANPTGPLTLGNARGGFVGDVIANVLTRLGYDVTREYYFNDAGTQIRNLVNSVRAHAAGAVTPETQYRGTYIDELAKEFAVELEAKTDDELGALLMKTIFDRWIKPAIDRMGVRFDVWFNERTLIDSGAFARAIERLRGRGLIYEQDGAVWLASKSLGDTRDRVVVKSNGDITYLGDDIAYHLNIFEERKFSRAIKEWGADHAPQILSLKLTIQKLLPEKKLEFVIHQFVRLLKGGEEFKMSKRAGTYVTVEDLLDEIGVDAARYFILMRSTGTHLDLDLDLAKEQSQKNPVYYVQYSYARAHQIFDRAGRTINPSADLSLLNSPEELALIKALAAYPELLVRIGTGYEETGTYEVHKLTTYVYELSALFHKFYEARRVLGEKEALLEARLALVGAYQIIMRDALLLLGISARERM
jgi:arginyl-tRNA synthetase